MEGNGNFNKIIMLNDINKNTNNKCTLKNSISKSKKSIKNINKNKIILNTENNNKLTSENNNKNLQSENRKLDNSEEINNIDIMTIKEKGEEPIQNYEITDVHYI